MPGKAITPEEKKWIWERWYVWSKAHPDLPLSDKPSRFGKDVIEDFCQVFPPLERGRNRRSADSLSAFIYTNHPDIKRRRIHRKSRVGKKYTDLKLLHYSSILDVYIFLDAQGKEVLMREYKPE